MYDCSKFYFRMIKSEEKYVLGLMFHTFFRYKMIIQVG